MMARAMVVCTLILLAGPAHSQEGGAPEKPRTEPSHEEVLARIKEIHEKKDPSERAKAVARLKYCLEEPDLSVPVLIGALSDTEARVRKAAAEALEEFGPKAQAATSALVTTLGDADRKVRCAAAQALGRVGPAAPETAQALALALSDKEWQVRGAAIEALDRMGAAVRECQPALMEAMRDRNLSHAAARVLAKIAETDDAGKNPVALWSRRLEAEELPWRLVAAIALQRLGADASPALPPLRNALADKDPALREYAAEAIGTIGPRAAAAVPDLVRALKDDCEYVRQDAAVALGSIGPDAREALPALEEATMDKAKGVQVRAGAALRRIRQEVKDGK